MNLRRGLFIWTLVGLIVAGSIASGRAQLLRSIVRFGPLRQTVYHTVIWGTSIGATISGSATTYIGTAQSATETAVQIYVPYAGTLRSLFVFEATAPGATKSYLFTVNKNTTPSIVTCTISGGTATTCTNLAQSVSVAAGDLIDLSAAPTNTPGATRLAWSAIIDSPTNTSLLIFSTGTSAATAQRFYSSVGTVGATSNVSTRTPAPLTGTLKNLYALASAVPGGATTRPQTVRSTAADSAVTCTIGAASTNCSDTNPAHTLAVTAGDNLSINGNVSGTPASATVSAFAELDVSTRAIVVWGGTSNATLSTSATTFFGIGGSSATTEANVQFPVPVKGTLKNFRIQASAAPSAGSYTITVRDGGDTALTCSLGTGASTCSDVTHSVAIAAGDILSVAAAPVSVTGTPNVTWSAEFDPAQ